MSKYYFFLAVYILSAFLRLLYFGNFSDSTDGIIYLSIAEKYLNGWWMEAINGSKSPLICWMLVPVAHHKENSFLLFGCLNVLIGVFFLTICFFWFEKLNLSKHLKLIFSIALIPLTLYYTIEQTPDLLYLVILLFLIYCLSDENYLTQKYSAFICGMTGVLLYLAKSFGFPFFLSCFFLVHVFYFFFQKDKKTVFKKFMTGICVFLFLSGIWISLLSFKYHRLVFSTVHEYDYAVLGPHYTQQEDFVTFVKDYLVFYNGLISPPTQNSIAAWEEPTMVNIKLEQWSKFSSRENFIHYFMLIRRNILSVIYNDITRILLLANGLVFIVFFYLKKTFQKNEKIKLLILFSTALLHLLGYCLIWVETRFLWPVQIILLISLAVGVKGLMQGSYKQMFSMVFLSFFALYFIFKSLNEIVAYFPEKELSDNIYELSQSMNKSSFKQTKFASISSGKINVKYRASLLLSYFMDSQYFGNLHQENPPEKINEEVKKYQIDYLLAWDENELYGYIFIGKSSLLGLNIYKCKY